MRRGESSPSARTFILLGAFLACLGVAAGAFGAHWLKQHVSPAMADVFETGVRYHMYHAFALLFTGMLALSNGVTHQRSLNLAGWCFLSGSLLFSGSLYIMVLTQYTTIGFITPLGGVVFLLGWGFFIHGFLRVR